MSRDDDERYPPITAQDAIGIITATMLLAIMAGLIYFGPELLELRRTWLP